jgi:hypothetical protein
MFEPFHPLKVKAFRPFHYFQYMRPLDQNAHLEAYCRTVFSGQIRNRWIDREVNQLKPQYRLIKEIRANLFLKWIKTTFPQIPIFFIIRHPCAVVASRLNLSWATDADIEPFLAQPELVQDFLRDKLDIIKQAGSLEEKHAIIWCISNLIPLHQFQADEFCLVYYEQLCQQPEVELGRILQSLGLDVQSANFDALDLPSMTSVGTSALVTGNDPISGWQKSLSSQQIAKILAIVEAFGLGHLYGHQLTPRVDMQEKR